MVRNALSTFFVFASVLAVAYFLIQPLSHQLTTIGTEHVALVSQMGARVEENPTNRIALDLKHRAEELDRKEQALRERELLLRKEQAAAAHRTRDILASTIGLSILTLLILHIYTKHRNDVRERTVTHQERIRHARTINAGLRVTIQEHHTHSV